MKELDGCKICHPNSLARTRKANSIMHSMMAVHNVLAVQKPALVASLDKVLLRRAHLLTLGMPRIPGPGHVPLGK